MASLGFGSRIGLSILLLTPLPLPLLTMEMETAFGQDENAAVVVTDGSRLQVDPLLIAEAAEVWGVIGKPGGGVWPDWDSASTPILFYLPGVQDVLINHPNPPSGFVPYTGPIEFGSGEGLGTIFVKDGPTIIEWEAQNTSHDVDGVEVLVVADSRSNLKSEFQGFCFDPRPMTEKFADLEYGFFGQDPYDQMGMIAHEAFHVYQFRKAPDKGGNEMDLAEYPTLSVRNNVGFALEAAALVDALNATTAGAVRERALRWLAVRQDRRSELSAASCAYEDGTEFNEGLAKYIEYRLFEVLDGSAASTEAIYYAQDFHGFADMSSVLADLVERMRGQMCGETNVNNDRFGAAPLRMRLYYSGMAIGALLDRLGVDWKRAILEPEITLTGLAEEALAASADELAAGLERALVMEGYEALVAEKVALRTEGLAAIEGRVARILGKGDDAEVEGTCLVFDYGRLGEVEMGFAFTPFGITPVDEERTLFGMAPFGAYMAGGRHFQQMAPNEVLHDRAGKRFVFRMDRVLSRDELLEALGLEELPSDVDAPVVINGRAIDGVVRLNVGACEISQDGNVIEFRYCDG